MTDLELKIARAEKVNAYYPGPHETKYAIIEYWARQGHPLKVAAYYNYGEELKTGEPLKCWHYLPSTNFTIIEDNFGTEADATARMKELRMLRK